MTAIGNSLVAVSNELKISYNTLQSWVYDNESLVRDYQRAREMQADWYAQEILTTARDETLTPESRRVQVEALKWTAAKLKPRVYGDKTILSNDPENPVSLLAIRLDEAIKKKDEPLMIDVTPLVDDGSDLV